MLTTAIRRAPDPRLSYVRQAHGELMRLAGSLRTLEAKTGDSLDLQKARKQLHGVERRLEDLERQKAEVNPALLTNFERALTQLERMFVRIGVK